MKTLWLLRHAQSSSESPAGDHERPLNPRGRDAAQRIGRYLAERGARPDLVLCSSALRTRETLAQLEEALGAPEIHVERALYLADATTLFRRVEELPDSVACVLLVGHNPGIGELAAHLAQRGLGETRADLRRQYPTAALAELRLESERWSDLRRGCELRDFVIPRKVRALVS